MRYLEMGSDNWDYWDEFKLIIYTIKKISKRNQKRSIKPFI